MVDIVSMIQKLPVQCPYCGAVNDGHTALDGSADLPSDGDIGWCSKCEHFSMFTSTPMGLGKRKLTQVETLRLGAELARQHDQDCDGHGPEE